MHDTAHQSGKHFFEIYFEGAAPAVLEVGSQNVNGTLRECTQAVSEYIGVDIAPADGVDVVLENPYSYPFEDNRFDAVVSSSCFEHDQLFWLSFLEMLRVTKHHGYIYLNVPSNGSYHGYPFDNWRFFPDAGLALVAWAKHQGQELALMESFIGRRGADWWNDCVLVFCKGGNPPNPPTARIADRVPSPYNVRRNGARTVEHFTEESEDMILLREAREQLRLREQELAQASERAAAYETALLDPSRNVAASAAPMQDVMEQLHQLVHQFGALQGEVEQLKAAAAASDQKQAILTSEAEQREAQLVSETGRLEREIAARDAKMGQLEKILAANAEAATATLDQLNSRLAASEEALPELRTALEAAGQKQTALVSQAEQQEARLAVETARLEREIAARDAHIAQIEAKLAAQGTAVTGRLSELDTRFTGSDAALQELRAGLAASAREHAALKSEVDQGEARLLAKTVRLEDQMAERNARIAEIGTMLATYVELTAEGLGQLRDAMDAERAKNAQNRLPAPVRAVDRR